MERLPVWHRLFWPARAFKGTWVRGGRAEVGRSRAQEEGTGHGQNRLVGRALYT